jgi:hypothetical protein
MEAEGKPLESKSPDEVHIEKLTGREEVFVSAVSSYLSG